MVEQDFIERWRRNTYDCKKYLNCSCYLKSDYFQGIFIGKFRKKQCFTILYIEFINYFQEISLVSGDDLCFGPNTVSVSVCQSNCR